LRHEQIGDQGDDRDRAEHDGLIEGKRPAAHRLRHQLGEIGVDRDQFDADADACDQPPQVDAPARVLKRHHECCGAVPQHRIGEDGPPAVFVRGVSEHEGADEETEKGRGHEQRRTLEDADLNAGKQPRLHQAGHEVTGHEEIVEFEYASERQQRNQHPHMPRTRQAIQPRQNGGRARFPRLIHRHCFLSLVSPPAFCNRPVSLRKSMPVLDAL
jgi:hypothetical protein